MSTLSHHMPTDLTRAVYEETHWQASRYPAMTDKLLHDEPEIHETWMRGAMLDRLGAPQDFKAPAVFLLASSSAWMTVADLTVNGGHTGWA
jgi:NAD(P)-dependent dehydrogenase (short-subunit alcohol dehydrogenase family)